jgi:DNA/RNA endonuclease G (NUC1)
MPKALRSASRNRLLILGIATLFGVSAFVHQMYFARRVHAAAFTPGNVVVYRVGDGAAALGSTATAVFLDEYTPTGTFVQSVAMPTAVAGSNRRLTASGTATNEGFLTLSTDGQYLALTGYDAALGTLAVAGTTSAAVQRVIGRVDSTGTVNTTTVFAGSAGNSFSGGGPRSVVSDAGNNFWAVGSVSGVQYITLGATSSTQVSNTATNLRGANIFGGQLYISSGAGTIRVGTVGTGTPTTTGQTITSLPGFPATPAATGFFFADLNAGVAGVDTVYVADDGGNQILKYSLVAGTWVANGSVAATGARGLTGSVQGTTVTLFGTLGGAGTTLYKLVDATGHNATISGSPTTIATVGTNRAFRGVAFAPSSGPPNQAIAPSCPASLSTVQGTPTSAGVSATDPDGTVTSATITSTPVTGITLTGFSPAGASGGTATATLSVANTTPVGTHSVTIQYQNSDPVPQTATCTVVVTVNSPNQPIAPSCPGTLTTNQGSAGSTNVSATDPDGTVTSASITSAPVTGITLGSFAPAGAAGGTASAVLNVANTTAVGSYNVNIQWTNNDSPTPQTASCTVVVTVQAVAPPNTVVISQVYGGGGNAGATLKNDYIELINHSSSPVNLSGWSVQAFVTPISGPPGSWQMTPLPNFTLQPGQYFLVQESQGAGGTDNLPTPDAIGTITVSSTSTKVVLVNNTTLITAACPSAAAAGIVDLVGYGATDCFEGSPAPTLDNTTAALRKDDGCFDTNDNSKDFLTGGPTPRNSSSPFNDCTGLAGFGSANPSSVLQGGTTTLTVYVAPAQNPASTGLTVTADLSQIGGSPAQAFTGGPNTFTFVATIPPANPTGMKSLPVTIADGQLRTATTNIVLSVLPLIADHVTISQLYGGGGNTLATYNHDYVELYNPTSTTTFDLTGWSLQYASSAGTAWQVQPLGGTIAPGEYYLIGLATNDSGVGTPLPPANVDGDINLSGTTGKVALVSNFDALEGGCPLGSPGIVDFLGYGGSATCAETTRSAAPSNTTSLFRKNNGETDSDNNLADFVTGPPNPRRTAPIVEIGPSVFGTDPRNNATSAPRDATIAISFTEPVTVDSGWYNINCVSSGNHNSATVRSFFGGDTHTITPNLNFFAGEQCTVTIFKDAIHDVDTNDTGTNADSLPVNKVFSFTVATGTAPPYPSSVHLTMGNPGGATPASDNNFLMDKPEFTLSYNRSRGTANWVSWHLSDDWIGTLTRVDTFRADPQVPEDWYRVSGFDYVGSGFDRGHLTPNADRDKETSAPINQATFLMSNMIPQAPDNNQGPWANLEGYLRTLAPANELYIVAGGTGTGGNNGSGVVNTIAGGNVTVPAFTWKVALILPKASGDDLARVNCSTRTLAVIMPNIQGIRTTPWETNYVTTVDAVEALTGYDFFSNLPDAVENCVEAGTDGANAPATANQSASTLEDTPVIITLQAVRPNTNPLTFSIVSGPTNGSLGSIGAPSCTDYACTATVTYTPGLDYDGSASFTFRVTQGATNSNTSTVNITVSPDEDGDGVVDGSDNCPSVSNSDQANFDGDSAGDACDPDDDNDGATDSAEIAAGSDPFNPASTPEVCDGVDNDLNDGVDEGFTNTDGDSQADCVDADDDNDGFSDTVEAGAGSDPLNANSTPEVCDGVDNDLNDGIDEGFTNTDGDSQADCVDADDDNDGFSDTVEAGAGSDPLNANSTPEVCDGVDNDLNDGIDEGFTNTDGDAQADCVDADDDNDGFADTVEAAAGSDPLNPASTPEVCDGVDNDLNDGVDEGFPNTDGDGQANCVDNDDDNDGFSDTTEAAAGSDPLNAASTPEVCDGIDNDLNDGVDEGFPNTDGDGQANCVDADDDNDGFSDTTETAAGSDPLNAASTPEVCDGVDNDLNEGVDEGFVDTDHDGLHDCVDTDDDGDGILDANDNCPLTFNPNQADFDHDGIGDVCDPAQGPPQNKEQCKNGGWQLFTVPRTFSSQGDCISFVNNHP